MWPASRSMSVSVLIPAYGFQEWQDLAWSRAFPSAREQTEDVHVFYDPEGSIASVRNELGQSAKGEWLCFLDADDELAPGYLDAMTRAAGQAGDGPVLLTPAVSYIRKERPSPPQFNDRGIPLSEDNWLVVGTLVRREQFLAVGGFSDYPHGFEDWSLWAKCWKAGAAIVKVPDAIYRAHVNPQSKHRQGWRDKRWQRETHLRVKAELFG